MTVLSLRSRRRLEVRVTRLSLFTTNDRPESLGSSGKSYVD
jgi:hypothetical protein